MSSAAAVAAWAGPRSARSRLKTSIHCGRASSRSVGDEVGDVAVAAAGHADVRRGGAGVSPRAGGRCRRSRLGRRGRWWRRRARRARATYVGGQRPVAGARRARGRLPSCVDAGDGPGVAVGDAEVAVVAAGGDPVADPEPLTGSGGDRVARRSIDVRRWRARWSRMAALRAPTWSRVSAMTRSARRVLARGRRAPAVRSTSVGWTTIWPRSPARRRPHQLRSPVRISRVRSAYSGSANRWTSRGQARPRACPAGGEVEDAAAADGGQLVPVADERDPGAGSRRRW